MTWAVTTILKPGLVLCTRGFRGASGRDEVGSALLAPGVDCSEELDSSNLSPKHNPLASRRTAMMGEKNRMKGLLGEELGVIFNNPGRMDAKSLHELYRVSYELYRGNHGRSSLQPA